MMRQNIYITAIAICFMMASALLGQTQAAQAEDFITTPEARHEKLINTPGAITVMAEDGLEPITETMQFLVVSPGDDRRGAFSRDGAALVEDCPANTQDAENCDGDATFRNLPNTQMVETNARFDDIVKFGHARPWRTCSFGGETVEHAGTIKRFQSAQSNNCTSQTYECNDGKLFWPADPERDTSQFFTHVSCSKPPPPPPVPQSQVECAFMIDGIGNHNTQCGLCPPGSDRAGLKPVPGRWCSHAN